MISYNIVSPLTYHSFLASKYALLYDAVENGGRAVYDEVTEAWTIPGIKTHCGGLRDRRRSMKMSEYVELDIEMPVKTTLDIDNPNTLDKISSILTMDLNNHLEEIPCKYTNRQDKMFRIDHVSARISLCKLEAVLRSSHLHFPLLAPRKSQNGRKSLVDQQLQFDSSRPPAVRHSYRMH